MTQQNSRLEARDVSLSYGDDQVLANLSLVVPDGGLTVIIGPNACGKSTLLRTLARVLRPSAGHVLLDGKEISQQPSRAVAKCLGHLPQTPIAPAGIRVADLVSRGRTPYHGVFQQWSDGDESATLSAMEATGILTLADLRIDDLSGGQRQRVWIAMALAQQTELLLLDEPTTYLDLRHQIDLLNLLRRLNRTSGKTIVCVLHDINLACRYADHIVAMRAGTILRHGAPGEVVTPALMRAAFELNATVMDDPVTGTPMVIPAMEP